MNGMHWYAVVSGILTFAILGMIDGGWAYDAVAPVAAGAYVRICLALVGSGVLLLLSRKLPSPRTHDLTLGAAFGVVAYGLAQVHYTPIYGFLAQ